MKKFGFGLLAALLLAAATVMTTAPAMAGRGGSGMIWIPPMGGGMGGGWNGGGMRGWNGGMNQPTNAWRAPGGRNYYAGKNYNGRWSGNVSGRNWKGQNWNGQHWNGKNWNGRPWNNWHRNGRWYGPRYRYRYPGYNYFNSGFWYPWPWWSYNLG